MLVEIHTSNIFTEEFGVHFGEPFLFWNFQVSQWSIDVFNCYFRCDFLSEKIICAYINQLFYREFEEFHIWDTPQLKSNHSSWISWNHRNLFNWFMLGAMQHSLGARLGGPVSSCFPRNLATNKCSTSRGSKFTNFQVYDRYIRYGMMSREWWGIHGYRMVLVAIYYTREWFL